ncbi:MAG: SDR family oxidoreductase [Spirochaetaceae bacterium]|nr:MAG: SDR family oxidoreductase [Spirochaetaceae bacterium]
MSLPDIQQQELTDLQVGPVLRGLDSGHTGTAPGSCFRYIPPEEAGDTGSDAPAAPAASATVTIAAPLTIASLAAQDLRSSTRLALPSGAQWIRTTRTDPPGESSGSAAPGDLTPRDLAGVLAGRVTIVTGAAQGFGWEIARGLAALGAVVALADINLEGVRARARELGEPHEAFRVNVTEEESIASLVDAVTARYGGIDLVVSNAGVLKAGSVKELSLKDFRFVTDVNYIGFFLMTRYSSPVMALQHAAAREAGTPYLTDIVEINSKSGLEGSNRNSAYAGSKFGGIGLVQSFALELVEQGTKVNAICPGNYLDGPLWSNPETGLFVQYLRTGKVPGATTLEDVRRFYESKVPLNRGCTGRDVVRALAYVVSQEYETGQAVPVTGGQVMLS